MKRLILATASLALFAAPATAAAASHGVILSASSKQHRVQVVDPKHVVHGYRVRGSVPRVKLGSLVTYSGNATTISKLNSKGRRAHSVSFLGRVVKASSAGVVLKLGDGQSIRIAKRQMTHAGRQTPVAVAAVSSSTLQPGLTVLVTEKLSKSGISVSFKTASAASAGISGKRNVVGVVTAVGTSSVTLKTANGTVTLQVPAVTIDNDGIEPCDTVSAVYQQVGNALNASNVNDQGATTSSCVDQQAAAGGGSGSGDASSNDGTDAIGNITAVSPTNVTINVTGQGSISFVVSDPSLTASFIVGDNVDVTYAKGSSGALDASDVEYNENDELGTVVTVSDSSITVKDSNTGANKTFTADPSEDMFDGISNGDSVDVSYHYSSNQIVVDEVDEAASGN